MQGRRPDPKHLKLVEPAKPATAPAESAPAAPPRPRQTIAAPSHLSKIAKAEYLRVAAELQRQNKWSELFRTPLAMYAAAYHRWRRAEAKLAARDAELAETPNGYEVMSAWLTIANKERAFMLSVAEQFGFTLVGFVRVASAQLDLFEAPPAPARTGTDDDGFEGF